MKMMARTNTRTSAITGGMTHGSAARERSDHAGARDRPRERADPADHDGDEALDQEAQAEIGKQREHRHDQRARKARKCGAERKGRAIDRVGRNARCAGERGIFQRRPNAQPEGGARQQQIAADHHQRRNEDDDQPPGGKMHGADIDRAAERLRDRQIQPADQTADDLADDEPERVGAEHRDDRRGIKSPDDGALQDKPQRADDKGRRQPCRARPAGPRCRRDR